MKGTEIGARLHSIDRDFLAEQDQQLYNDDICDTETICEEDDQGSGSLMSDVGFL